MGPAKRAIALAALLFLTVGFGIHGVRADVAAQTSDPVMVGAGDITNCRRDEDEATARLLDDIQGTVFTIGDTAYPDGSPDQFRTCYDPTWGRHKLRTRPAVGNHEYHTPGASGYYTYFGLAASPLDAGCLRDCKGYYSYDLGEWHIIVLNSEIDMAAGSEQEQWLRADLEANPRACTLAYWHDPRFNSGRHGNVEKVTPLWDALYEHHADIVLNGHDHNYQRFGLQDPNGNADPKGIREFVVGTGGAGLYGFITNQPNTEARDSSTYGVLKLTLHATSYTWEFIPIAGSTFTDSGTADCVTDGAQVPSATSPALTSTPEDVTVTAPTATVTPTVTAVPAEPPEPAPVTWWTRFVAWLSRIFRRG